MINGMYLSTMGALVQARRHEVTANNLANAATAGFKPDWAIFRSVPAESVLQPGHRTEIDSILEKTGGGVWLSRTATNFRSGILKTTGNPLDLALVEPDGAPTGFFMIRKSGSEEVEYTRDGHFTLDAEGRLVNTEGGFALSTDREILRLPQNTALRVTEEGVFFDDKNNELGRIGMVETADPSALRKVGDNLLRDEEGATRFTPRRHGLRSGALEDSGTNAILEMAGMVEGHRTYEANMKFLSLQDETLGQVVTRIAAVA